MPVNTVDGNGMPFLQALSQFYLLLLFPTKVQCINRVNGQVRQELPLTPSRTLSVGPQTAESLALASDDAEGTVYLMAGDLKIPYFGQAVAVVLHKGQPNTLTERQLFLRHLSQTLH